MKKISIILVLCISVISLFAQKGKIELKLNLRDGNIISGTSESISTVTLITDFGKLDIPIKNVSAIQFGITPDISSKSKIVNLIKQMNDPTPEKRQAAYEELVKMSINTIPVINDYIYGSEYQTGEFTDYTPEAALTEMKGTYNLDEGFNNKDVVSIDYEYTIGGTFNLKSISLKTEFGLLDVPKEKIKNVEISYFDEQSGDKSYKLLASKHISGNDNGGWLNTGVKVKTGQKIAINATGEITLESLSGNKYTPDGNATSDVESTNESSYPTYGNVVYKIGESGEMIKAGSKYSGKAKDSGTLFLSIYETVYNSANTGTYSVKVSLK